MSEPLIITTTPRDDHQLTMDIQLGPERTQEALQRAARLVSKRAKIPGFRPGKAPFATVMRMFGRDAVLQEILDDLGQEVYREALDLEKLEPYGQAGLEDVQMDPLTFKLVIPLRPSVELGDYRSIRLETPQMSASEADVEATIEKERAARATWTAVERPAAIGDTVVMDIVGTVGESKIMDNPDWELLLKEESGWLPGFDASFVGMRPGEEKAFSLTYPEDSASRYKGQQAEFKATVKAVKAKVEPGLDDEFARSLGEYADLADLRTKLTAQLTEQRTQEAENKLHDAAIEAVIAGATIAYPPQAVDDMVDDIMHDLQHRVQDIGYSLEDYLRLQSTSAEQYRTQVRPSAEKRLKGRLVLSELARREQITVSRDETQAEFDRLLARAQEPAQADTLRQLFESGEGRVVLRQDVLTEKTLARLRAIVSGQAPELTEAPAASEPAEAPAADEPPAAPTAAETAAADEPVVAEAGAAPVA